MMSGSGLLRLMTAGQPPAMLKLIETDGAPEAFAPLIASRRLPQPAVPQSVALVTVNTLESVYRDSYAPRSVLLPILRGLPTMSVDGSSTLATLVPAFIAGDNVCG